MKIRYLLTVILTLLGATVLVALAVVAGAYSGRVNVSAGEPPSALTHWFLTTTRDHSIEARAKRLVVPDLTAPTRIAIGADHYHEMCEGCHGAPGVGRDEAGQGLDPPPPVLYLDTFDNEDARETFWTVKHGIRMTGMPAFGPTHDDQKIWDIVAFVRAMHGMSPEDYSKATHPQPPQPVPPASSAAAPSAAPAAPAP